MEIRNINGRINDLTVQILSRYNAIFSKDPAYREPTKVILKSSDDLILFDQDLIRDVLTDSAQVHVTIEAYKEAPKLDEIYEDLCKSSEPGGSMYANVKKLLKSSTVTFNLDLSEIICEHKTINRHFNIIINSIQTFAKQNLNSPTNYFNGLVKMDLSLNYLTDQIVCDIIENLISQCQCLKILNLANNLITIKSFKVLTEINIQTAKVYCYSLFIFNFKLNFNCQYIVFMF